MILNHLYKGITMITRILSDTQDILEMTSPCKTIDCATIATGYTRKMELIHNNMDLESVGTKIAALYGTGENAITCKIDDSRLFNKKLLRVPSLESTVEWVKDPEQKKGPKNGQTNMFIPDSIFLPHEVTEELLHRMDDSTDPQEALELIIHLAEEQDEAREI